MGGPVPIHGMEAMVSGALVMTDTMLSLPTGYHDATNIVEYHSAVDLLEKSTSYLNPPHESEGISMATKGRTVAMTQPTSIVAPDGRNHCWTNHVMMTTIRNT
mmetsp:Transcript_6120/g.6041  ORF Transcript_6120/g.6041 Transcript_6120/m.6041 type:complete len:103 (+) Transcript_6120:71-379(+)